MKYIVEMISREADYDATVTINAASEDQAKCLAPKFMARPELWLVTNATTQTSESLLRSQLGARDAALDAILELLTDNSTISESIETRTFRERVLLRLAKHGAHPR